MSGPWPGHDPANLVKAPEQLTITRWQLAYVGWTVTLLAYIVVLNLWVEFNGEVVIDEFVISIATAAVLLLLLEVVDIIFGEHVELGSFVDVLLLVLLLIVAQRSMVWVWQRLGVPGSVAGGAVLSE